MRLRAPTLATWFGLVLAAALAVMPLLPPPAVEATAPATEFSAERAFAHVAALAREPHPMGSPEIAAVRAGIVARLDAIGLEAATQSVTAPDYFGSLGGTVEVVNVMARIPGTASTGAILLMGHYDTEPATPGANDDTAAVAVILETARAVLAGDPLRNDLILLFTDGEEPAPRYGSGAFVADHPWAGDVGFVVNLEAVGGAGPSLLVETAGPQGWIMERYAAAVPDPAAFSFLTATAELIGGSNTDFAPFRDAGVSGVEMAYLHGSPIYHTAADAPERVSLRSLQHHGDTALALVRRIGDEDLALAPGPEEVVFFPIARWPVVYPAGWSLPAVALAGALLAAAVRTRWRPVLRSATVTLGAALAGAVVAVAVWMVVAGVRDSMGIVESYLYLAVLAVLAAGTASALGRWRGRRRDASGVVAVWWLLALLLTLVAPGLGVLFLWPALIGSIVLWLPASGPWVRAMGTVLAGGAALLLAIPAVDVFYQLAQPRPGNPDSQILYVVAIPALLVVLVVDLVAGFAGVSTGAPVPEAAPSRA